MTAARHSPNSSSWRQLASLGEQLLSEHSLSAQRDHIVSMISRLIPGDVDVWLEEALFRLPDWEAERLFPPKPPLDGMRRAIKSGRMVSNYIGDKTARGGAYAALPLEDHGLVLGALQVTRLQGPRFRQEELDQFEGLARIVTVGLFASHRVEVERFRLGQLSLVREVSAQIANVLDLDELARRVTELIQKTFHYYYVAIFTFKSDSRVLRFRSSASAPRKGKKKSPIALEVEPGQGLIGEAASLGQQIVYDDVHADPRFRFIDSLPETRSEVVIPLKVEDRILGVLDVQSNQLKSFHPNDLLVLNALADNVAYAVEGARLYGDLQRRADQLSVVAEVSKRVTSTLDLAQLMNDAAALIHTRFDYPFVSLFTVHPNRRLISYEAGSGKRSGKLRGHAFSLDDPHGIIPWVARAGQTVLANDVTKETRYSPSSEPPGNTRSELTVPLIFNEKVLGILDIQSDRPNAFNEEDRMMFEAVAGTIAAAIRNADLFQSERWRRQVSEGLREVAGLLSANVGVEEVLEAILVDLERNLPVDVSAIWLVGEGEATTNTMPPLFLAAAHGAHPHDIENACRSSPEASLALSSALASETPMIRKPGDPILPSGLAAGFDQNYSSLVVPMRLGEKPLGLITIAQCSAGRYGHEAQAMAVTFASYAAVAIENARLYDTAQEQAYASAALLQVAQAVVSLSDLDEILASIVRILPILVGIKRAVLYLWEADRQAFKPSQAYGFSEQAGLALTHSEFSTGSFPLLDLARQQNHLIIHPLKARASLRSWLRIKPRIPAEEDRIDHQIESHLNTANRLLMVIPISIKNDLFGVMLLEEGDGGQRYRARRFEIINGIAQQAALAIQNDRLQQEMVGRERLETEIQLARQIQQTFIPESLPQPPNWQLAARWRTARQVGGDFYDVILLPDQKLGLFIADVADKGMPAALFMALTRTLVRAAILETDSPAETLRRVNDLLLPDTRQGMFVTAVYGVLDIKQGDFTYMNAGHNPPLWMRSHGRLERLTRTGIALGLMVQPEITQRTIQLEKGDSLLLYTDGVTEAFSSNGDQFGEDRLQEALRSAQAEPAEQLLTAIEARLNEFITPLPLSDDLTMLAVRRL
jgi:sigma-B regulation protein RsbU (phosphoserine phosphatase)